ncbi:hypothetical protein H3H51_12395 [Pseudomonas sp. UL070]|uniref:Uncharacterized protein n=2 Tax=Aquipseudomonas ullengensis TaxID=2759166 RepID=A0A7W4LME9_9GAMM|nr:hypothetical protein [Pseudomonas ullengensis]
MESEKPMIARPKLVGYSLLFLVIPLDIWALSGVVSRNIENSFFIALLCIPASYFVARCLSTEKQDISELISLREARIIYSTCITGALVAWFWSGFLFALPGFLAALFFSIREHTVRKIVRGVSF